MNFNSNAVESTRRLLVRGIASAKANEKDIAIKTLKRVLTLPCSLEIETEANYWLAVMMDDPSEKRHYLEEVLASNPAEHRARRMLAVLNGELQPDEIIDPNDLPPQDTSTKQINADKFECLNCGGHMSYSPDGASLTCDYCTSTAQTHQPGSPEEKSFVVGISTIKGHQKPIAMQSFSCTSCGAAYIVSPTTLSLTCPHCSSAYAVDHTDPVNLIPPEGIIPFSISEETVYDNIFHWLKQNHLETRPHIAPPQPVYYPVWTFDIGGEIGYSYLVEINDQWFTKKESKLIHFDDLMVPAASFQQKLFNKTLKQFQKDAVIAFETHYLANIPAETYSIKMSDAAIDARALALDLSKPGIKNSIIKPYQNLNFSSLSIIIESFKLILVPVWFCTYTFSGSTYDLIANGYTEDIHADLPPTRLEKLVNRLFGKS